MPTTVKFYFDVACPFAWKTSQWIREVESHRDIDVEWIPMSLSVLNEDQDIPEEYAEKQKANWGPARVFTKVKNELPEKVGELYEVMGTIVHHENEAGKDGFGAYDDVIARALEKAGIDASFAEVANTEELDADLRAYHQQGQDAVGDTSGTPIVQIEDNAFFGPVITRFPDGEEAAQLFDAYAALAAYPYFFEMKRNRTEAPQLDNGN
ncbi:disulfide bond formation protein DsbA [Corynebacterium yudongzhengii]|uniref:Disulfide bond formation protein DsbA n=1 Tax=Corynebacterium yudongzhengii TaxID=2080740 RepID=A0A2U1T8V9_9CORY|nr:DsbA family protein [Corynebacterium yudongzhengii]AWB82511.1 disulfide bond formation protein DsbA [Corynebacterium yudongzhengii]PWC02433.1 disulfide bond formation protein DsbA [Corynebacterium yudongzhengii]